MFVARLVRAEQAKKDERKQMGYKDHQERSTTQCDEGVNYNCTGLRSHLTFTAERGDTVCSSRGGGGGGVRYV